MAILGLMELYARAVGTGMVVMGLLIALYAALFGYFSKLTNRGAFAAIFAVILGAVIAAAGMVVCTWQ